MKKILIVDDDASVMNLLVELLKREGHAIETADNGEQALAMLAQQEFDLMVCDVWMPGISGLDVLARMKDMENPPAVVMMTADDAPETMLRAVRENAHHFVSKPFKPADMLDAVREGLAIGGTLPIEVISAKPDWVELLVPCEIKSVDRIQAIMQRLKTGLPEEVRDSVSQAFRELLLNAIEWGGKLDKNSKVRISFLRAKRMLLYRISDPGQGFNFEGLDHAAITNPPDDPISHMRVREERGIRPGGLGILMTQSLVDELHYNEAHNEVVFIKYLD